MSAEVLLRVSMKYPSSQRKVVLSPSILLVFVPSTFPRNLPGSIAGHRYGTHCRRVREDCSPPPPPCTHSCPEGQSMSSVQDSMQEGCHSLGKA